MRLHWRLATGLAGALGMLAGAAILAAATAHADICTDNNVPACVAVAAEPKHFGTLATHKVSKQCPASNPYVWRVREPVEPFNFIVPLDWTKSPSDRGSIQIWGQSWTTGTQETESISATNWGRDTTVTFIIACSAQNPEAGTGAGARPPGTVTVAALRPPNTGRQTALEVADLVAAIQPSGLGVPCAFGPNVPCFVSGEVTGWIGGGVFASVRVPAGRILPGETAHAFLATTNGMQALACGATVANQPTNCEGPVNGLVGLRSSVIVHANGRPVANGTVDGPGPLPPPPPPPPPPAPALQPGWQQGVLPNRQTGLGWAGDVPAPQPPLAEPIGN